MRLTPEDKSCLEELYLREDLPRQLTEAFAATTSRVLPAPILIAAMMAHRKCGLLPCLEFEKKAKTALPFADIAEVDRKHRKAASG